MVKLFYNDKDPDNILSEVNDFVSKFESIVTRCNTEQEEWDGRQTLARERYESTVDECNEARGKLDKARVLAGKFLKVFE